MLVRSCTSYFVPSLIFVRLVIYVCGGWVCSGDEEEHLDHNSRAFFVIKVAYQVYCEYQKQLLCDTDGKSLNDDSGSLDDVGD